MKQKYTFDAVKNSTLGDRLAQALLIRGMTASDLSRASKLSTGTISRYLSGGIDPKVSSVRLMALALGVADAWLLGFDVPMERPAPTASDEPEIPRLIREQEAQIAAGNKYAEELRAVQGGGLSETEIGLLKAFRKLELVDQIKVLTLCLDLLGGGESQ